MIQLWFGFYSDGDSENLLPAQRTKLYTEDWIGLKTLEDAGKVNFVSVGGEHLQMSIPDVVKYVVPYLQNQPYSKQNRFNRRKEQNTPHMLYACLCNIEKGILMIVLNKNLYYL